MILGLYTFSAKLRGEWISVRKRYDERRKSFPPLVPLDEPAAARGVRLSSLLILFDCNRIVEEGIEGVI